MVAFKTLEQHRLEGERERDREREIEEKWMYDTTIGDNLNPSGRDQRAAARVLTAATDEEGPLPTRVKALKRVC